MQGPSYLALVGFHLRELGRYPRTLSRLLRRPTRIRLRGVWLELGDEVSESSRQLLYSERYERGESRCVILALAREDVVLEVGAGIGYLSALCALRLGSEKVHTYEANPKLIPVIARNHRLNGVTPCVFNAMLAGQTGTTRFFPAENFFSSTGVVTDSALPGIDVPTLSVREEFARIRPTFVLMDIEGGESSLVPLIDWTGVRKLAIELHPHLLGAAGMKQVLSQLESAGFSEHRFLSSHRKRFFFK